MNKYFGQQNMTLNRTQSMMQRSWAREDWGYSDQTRALQWGWQQEDYAEESRFLTGRARRKATRENERATTMHNLQEDQIDRERGRQEELWALEDKRYELQKKQFEESYKLQQRQLDASKKYYEENFELQEKQTKLARQHYEAEIKLQREAAKAAAEHANRQYKLQQTMVQMQIASQHFEGSLKSVADNGFEKLKQALLDINPLLVEMANNINALMSGGGASGGSGGGSGSGIGQEGGGGGGSGDTTGDPIPMAHGGRIFKGQRATINEIGRETFIADRDGTILPSYSYGRIPSEYMLPEQTDRKNEPKPTIVHVYIGNEQIHDYVVKTMNNEIE